MPKQLPLLITIAGLALAALHLFDLAEALYVLVVAMVEGLQESGEIDPTAMAGVLGEVAITLASRGLFTLIPAALLYVAWVPLRYRPRWFHRAILAAGIYFTQLFPTGTVIGIILLIAVRRNKAAAV